MGSGELIASSPTGTMSSCRSSDRSEIDRQG